MSVLTVLLGIQVCLGVASVICAVQAFRHAGKARKHIEEAEKALAMLSK